MLLLQKKNIHTLNTSTQYLFTRLSQVNVATGVLLLLNYIKTEEVFIKVNTPKTHKNTTKHMLYMSISSHLAVIHRKILVLKDNS